MDRAGVLAASRDEARRWAGQRVSEVTPSRRDFALYVSTQRTTLAVVARLAPAARRSNAAQLIADARAWDDAEVAALAVATGPGEYALDAVQAVAGATSAPILRDDLIVHPAQLYATRLHGADAAVLPAGDLDPALLHELVTVARSLHMAAIVEVLGNAGLETALQLPHVIIGIRCTDVQNRLDVIRARALAEQVPSQHSVLVLTEITAAAEAEALRGVCDAIVVGDAVLAPGGLAELVQRLSGS